MDGAGLAGYRALIELRDYRLFWLGFTLSVLGDALGRVALTWYVYEETDSARALGWLMLCYTGPILIGGLAAGALGARVRELRGAGAPVERAALRAAPSGYPLPILGEGTVAGAKLRLPAGPRRDGSPLSLGRAGTRWVRAGG